MTYSSSAPPVRPPGADPAHTESAEVETAAAVPIRTPNTPDWASIERVVNAAWDAFEAGICVIPPATDGTKKPGVGAWKEYQGRKSTEAEMKWWYGTRYRQKQPFGLGVVTGTISGNLELLLSLIHI